MEISASFLNILPLISSPHPVYLYRRADYDEIRSRLAKTDWTLILSQGSVDGAVETFYSILYQLRNDFVPIKSARKAKYPPWFSIPLIKILKEKAKFHRKFKVYGNRDDEQTFKLLRDRAKKVERESYNDYILSIENEIVSNPKAFWTFSKDIRQTSSLPSNMTYLDESCLDGSGICNLFSKYFSSTFLQQDSGPISVTQTYAFNQFDNSLGDIASIEVNVKQVCQLLKSLDLSKSAGPDDLPAVFLSNCADELCVPVSILFGRSLQEGIMPHKWKLAYVTPIHKKGPKGNVENYRPISKLCLLAKVIERLVFDQTYNSLSLYLSPYQHVFLKNRSTVTNLAVFTDFLTEQVDRGNQIDVIYTDYSKAFDRIDHDILLLKLQKLGIRGDLFRWFSSYILNRSQAVVIKGYISTWTGIPSGVPQGSLLGPLLFTIFINDIHHCFSHSRFLLFADDMKVFRVVNKQCDAIKLQADLSSLDNYCHINKLDLNVSKCFSITFARKKHTFAFTYAIKNHNLTSQSEAKDLGVILDRRLMFDKHITNTINKASKALGFVVRMSKCFRNMKTIKIIYCSYVRSHLEYASVIWNPLYDTYKAAIEKLQKRFTRFLFYKFRIPRMSYNERCSKLHLAPLDLRRGVSDVVFLLKLVRGVTDCPDLLGKIALKVPSCGLRNNVYTPFSVPFARTNYRQNSFLVRACLAFNKMNIDVDLFHDTIHMIRMAMLESTDSMATH